MAYNHLHVRSLVHGYFLQPVAQYVEWSLAQKTMRVVQCMAAYMKLYRHAFGFRFCIYVYMPVCIYTCMKIGIHLVSSFDIHV